jgi:tetratricopeptide (TPR) repeat protein
LDLIRKSIALDPNFAEAHYTLGNILRDQGHLEEAIAAFGQVVALNPDSPKAFNNLGSALARNGQVEESIAAFGRAIALDPHYANALNNLGTALELAGDLAGAERCYRQAIKDATNHVDSHAKLASLLGRNLPDKDLAAMETLLADPSINPASKSYLHFAMAHVLDGRERYQEAADHLRLANALYQALGAAKGEVYDPAAHERFGPTDATAGIHLWNGPVGNDVGGANPGRPFAGLCSR